MRVDSLSSVGVTKNGNPYKKSKAGKKMGEFAGAAYVGTSAAMLVKNGGLKRPLAKVMVSLRNLGMKNPKIAAYGAAGAGVLLAMAIAVGVGKLIGAGVDKIINSRRAKAADNAAAEV